MPCDVNDYDNRIEYENVLVEISTICIQYDAEYVCIVGDLNTDTTRLHSWHTQSLTQFVNNEGLCFALNYADADVKYTYHNEYHNSFSIIDHFIVSQNLSSAILGYYSICEDVDNVSDHSPLVLMLNIDFSSFKPLHLTYKPRRNWKNASNNDIHKYQCSLDTCLSMIDIHSYCLQCNDLLCTNTDHVNCIQALHDEIISAIIKASEDIPETGKQSKTIPGWNDHVKPLQKTALFWHDIWKENNSPKEGHVADIMRMTRLKYHYAIRHVKSNNEKIKKKQFATALSENDTRQFWTEVKKIRNKNVTAPTCVDNITGDDNIAHLFAMKYNELYSSVKYDDTDLTTMLGNNDTDVRVHCLQNNNIDDTGLFTHTHVITVEHVQFAINKLKSGKSDSIDELLSDNLKNGTHLLSMYISHLLNCMLVHGVAPDDFSLSTIVPIPKNKRINKCDSNNYRAIAISSLLGKILDIIIFEEQYKHLATDVLQFGYKRNSSTILCTTLMLDTIKYYRENNSDCYLLLLDASKAFDRVEYVKLFNLLRDRSVCPVILRLIMNMYINQKIQIKWNNLLSNKDCITNGVKQGGVLSPMLYSVYVDNLTKLLRKSNIGCRYGNEYVGMLSYADDISLLCPTLSGIQRMLEICEEYARLFKITFNAKKSQLLYFSGDKNDVELSELFTVRMQDGKPVSYVKDCIHLGTPVYTDCDHNHYKDAINELNKKTNYLLADFSFSDSTTLSRLHSSYCMNIYGSQMWQYNDKKHLKTFYTAWRKNIRRIWDVNPRTHNTLLHHINDCLPIDILLEKRCIKFIWNLINSDQQLYSRIVHYSLNNCDTPIGENVRYFMHKYQLSYKDWYSSLSHINTKIYRYVNLHCTNMIHTGIAIRDLCESRDSGSLQNFNKDECRLLIDSLCIN